MCVQKWEQRATLGSSSFDFDIIPPSDHSGTEMPDHVISDRMRRQFGKFLMFDFRKLEPKNYYGIIGKGRSAHIVSFYFLFFLVDNACFDRIRSNL